MPYLSATVSKDKAEKVALDTLSHFFKEMQEKTKVVEEEEEGEDLCNCEFSLAYGTYICCLALCIQFCTLLASFREIGVGECCLMQLAL